MNLDAVLGQPAFVRRETEFRQANREEFMAANWQKTARRGTPSSNRPFCFPKKILVPAIAILACGYFVSAKFPLISQSKISSPSTQIATGGTSQVKSVDGRARLFINGIEYNKGITQIYYFPEERAAGLVPAYGTDGWISSMKRLFDQAKSVGTGIVIANIWWSEVDKARSRAANPEIYYDFEALDKVMDYAKEKGVYVMPALMLHWYAPEWWHKENNFPPKYNNAKPCDFCETDSFGHIYNNPSIGSDITERDFGTFIKAVVNRYKTHPALAGWVTGLGATGEDNYGPNYIMMIGSVGGLGTIERKPLTFTDYSPFFQRMFRKWLQNKYPSDSALRTAWNDNRVRLSDVGVPPAWELVKNPDTWFGLFPEEGADMSYSGGLHNLTKKGEDFYNFRTYMIDKSREYYASLFKTIDPDHVVFFNAAESKATLSNPNINGAIRNDNFCFECPHVKQREDQYWKLAVAAKKYAENGKIMVFVAESGAAAQQRKDSIEHLAYITAVEKAVKCAGGISGYASDLVNGNFNLYPTWASAEAQKGIKEINDYTPSGNCSCDLVNTFYKKICSKTRPDGCSLVDRAKREFCGSSDGGTLQR
jgi:hypothetical protein